MRLLLLERGHRQLIALALVRPNNQTRSPTRRLIIEEEAKAGDVIFVSLSLQVLIRMAVEIDG